MPLIRYIQKITRDPNFLVWRDTVYINADGRPQYLSLKLISDIDALLQGKISEYVFQSEFKEVKFSCDEIKIIGRSLIGEYLFYEGNGSIIHDMSGNKNNLSVTGNVIWKQLLSGKYYFYLDGSTRLATTTNVRCSTLPIFIEFLIKCDTYKQGWHSFIDWGYKRGGGIAIMAHAYQEKLTLSIDNGHETWGFFYPDMSDVVDKWVHCVAGFTSEPKILFYKNGTYYGEATPTIIPKLPDTTILVGYGNFDYTHGNFALLRIFAGTYLITTTIQQLYKLAKIMIPDLP